MYKDLKRMCTAIVLNLSCGNVLVAAVVVVCLSALHNCSQSLKE